MRDRLVELLRSIARLVHRVLPKARYAVIWAWPDHEDSALALEQALQRTNLRRVVLLMTDPSAPAPHPPGPKTRSLAKASARGFLAFLFARYVFFTHRCFLYRFPPRVVSVNLWHGMPIKRVGHLLEGDVGLESRYVLATSERWAEIMGRSMTATGEVLVTGLPRNDRLFSDPGRVHRALGIDGRDDVRHVVAWLPTFRRSVRGRITVDGVPAGTPFELPDVDPDALNSLLAERSCLAIVKPHPMAAFDGVQLRSHLWIVDDQWIKERGVSLYELLGACELLISDISSVTVDYLLLDRPIIHCIADLDEYGSSRGFSVPDVRELLAGPVVGDLGALMRELDAVLSGADRHAQQRARARRLSHAHTGTGATERLLGALGLLSEAAPQPGSR